MKSTYFLNKKIGKSYYSQSRITFELLLKVKNFTKLNKKQQEKALRHFFQIYYLEGEIEMFADTLEKQYNMPKGIFKDRAKDIRPLRSL